MEDIVRRKLIEIQQLQEQHTKMGTEMPAGGRNAYYNVDKKEVSDRHWSMAADILRQLGLEPAEDPSTSRSLTIPYELVEHFDERILAPWHAAWSHFRKSRARGGAAEQDAEHARSSDGGGSSGAAAGEVQSLPTGDSVFSWGCLDWMTSNMSNANKKGERNAFASSRRPI